MPVPLLPTARTMANASVAPCGTVSVTLPPPLPSAKNDGILNCGNGVKCVSGADAANTPGPGVGGASGPGVGIGFCGVVYAGGTAAYKRYVPITGCTAKSVKPSE